MRNTCFPSALILALGLFSLPSAHAQSLADEAKGFKAELPVFFKESAQLVANTEEVDRVLAGLDTPMTTTHDVATALQQLKTSLDTINTGLVAAKLYPPAKDKVDYFQGNVLDPLRAGVDKVARPVKSLDDRLKPLRIAVSSARGANKKLLDQEKLLQQSGKKFGDQLVALADCALPASLPDSTQVQVFIQAKSLYGGVDKVLQEVNTGYANAVRAPKDSISRISEKLRPIGELGVVISPINQQIQPLHGALAELDRVMNQSVGFSFAYAPSVEICWKEVPIPCLKFWEGGCSQSVPYPCPKIGVDVSISVKNALGGADAIQREIESKLSSVAWGALKALGVGRFVQELQNEANGLMKPVFDKVLDQLKIKPQLDLDLDLAINFDINQINQLSKDLDSFGLKLVSPSRSFQFSPDGFLSYRTLDELFEYGCNEPPWRVCLSDFARFGALGQSGKWKQSGSLELREQKHDKAIVAGDKYFGEDSRVYHQVRDQRLNGLWKFTEAPGSEKLPISEKCSFVLTDDGHGRYLSGGDAPGLVYHQRWRNALNQVWELRRVLDDNNQVMGYVLRDQRHWRCVIGGVIDSNTYNQQLSHEICMPSVRSVFKNRGNVLWNLYTSDGKLLRP